MESKGVAPEEVIETTSDGLSVDSIELMPGTEAFKNVCHKLRIPDSLHCIAISVIKPWKADYDSFVTARDSSVERFFGIYQAPTSIDIHDVLRFGFPTTDQETFVHDDFAVEGGNVFSSSFSVFSKATLQYPLTVLMCDIVIGGTVLDCENISVVSRSRVEESHCSCARRNNIWAFFAGGETKCSVLPRYLLRLQDVPQPLRISPSLRSPLISQGGEVHVKGSSITHAIAAAKDGDTLIVAEGLYRETIVLTGKSLRIVADGNVIIQAPADSAQKPRPTAAVRMSGPHRFVLEGITIRANKRRDSSSLDKNAPIPQLTDYNPDVSGKKSKAKKSKSKAKAQFPLIDQGRCANSLEVVDGVLHAHLVKCTFAGGAEVSNGSSAWFQDCVLTDGVVNGMYVCSASILMEDCTVSRHDSANVAVENSDSAFFIRCKIYGSLSTGVYLFNKGCATFEDCDIFCNSQTGIQMEGEGTNPLVRFNRLHHGEQYGMFITSKATGNILANHFYGNIWAGIAITEGGDPVVEFNSLYRGLHYGIYCFDNGLGKVSHNFVHHNKDGGLSIASGAAPVVRHNEFYQGQSYGCYFFLKGNGTIEHNRIVSNGSANVCITYGSDPLIRKNRICGSQTEGVSVMQEGKGTVEENEIFSNLEGNVTIQFEGDPIVRKNKIYSSKKTGVCILHKGKGTVTENDIFGSDYSGLAIKTYGDPVVEGNRIHDNKRYAVLVQMKGKGTVRGNVFLSNKLGSCKIWGDSKPLFLNNTFDESEGTETRYSSPPQEALPAPPSVPAPEAPQKKSDVTKDATRDATKLPGTRKTVTTEAYPDLIPGEDFSPENQKKNEK